MADMNSSPCPDTSKTSLHCPLCHQTLRRPHVLPCLHVFCLQCLQDECPGDSAHQYVCPVCAAALPVYANSSCARPWHAFDRLGENEVQLHPGVKDDEVVTRVTTSLSASAEKNKEQWEVDDNKSDDDSSTGSQSMKNSAAEQNVQLLSPCQLHGDKMADTFCFRCNQLACNKCISSFHRRCPDFRSLHAAVDCMRDTFDLVHGKMASNLVACEEVNDSQSDRIKQLDEMRTKVLIDIKTYRTELVNLILAKEKSLVAQTNRAIDQMKADAVTKRDFATCMIDSVRKQLDFLDLSFSINGEGELLPLLSGLATRVEMDAGVIEDQHCVEDIQEVAFVRDDQWKETLTNSPLGQVRVANCATEDDLTTDGVSYSNGVAKETMLQRDLNLTLVNSFHGGTRDDITEPLLTDLILLANGDVIITDRDNRCVKKFNQSGQLLTRVVIEAAPSRIASVSHGRAVVSVMAKKALYFLSLLGTVRVLNSVPVKKIYSFLTSLGNGFLVAGTNQCDSIDLLSERGETIRKIFTQKPDRAIIARPLYLTPVAALSARPRPKNSSPNHQEQISSDTHKHSRRLIHHKSVKPSSLENQDDFKQNSSVEIHGFSEQKRESLSETQKNNAKNSANANIISNDKYNNTRGNSKYKNNSISSISNNSNNNKNNSKSKAGATTPSSSSHNSHSQANISRRQSFPATKQNPSSSSSSSLNPPNHIPSSHVSLQTKKVTDIPSLSNNTTITTSSTYSSHPTSTSTSSPTDLDLLVSDSGKRLLFRLQQDGQVTFSFKSDQEVTLECPLGVTVHECGLTLLADRDKDCVLLLDQGGNCVKKVLSDCDGLSKPCGLYAGTRGRVALTQVDGTVKIYKPR